MFNSTSLSASFASSNLSAFSNATALSAALANYLVGTISYLNNSAATNESASPTYATVGHAPSSAGTVGAGSKQAGAGRLSVRDIGSFTGILLPLFMGVAVLWV